MARSNSVPAGRGVATPPSLAEIRKRELKRFSKAVESAAGNLKEKATKQEPPLPATDPYYADLDIAALIISRGAEGVLKHVPLMRERERGRYKWDIFTSGVRSVTRKFRTSFLAKFLFPMMHLEKEGEYLHALAGRYVGATNAISNCFAKVERYAEAYSYAINKTESLKMQEARLCARYADLKTWTVEEDYELFAKTLESTLVEGIEIIVEDSIKFYLLLSPERFMFILRAASAGSLSDLLHTKDLDKELQDALLLPLLLKEAIETSALLKVFRELLPEAMREYVKLWKKDHDAIRRELPTEESRRRFVSAFESGALFRTKETSF